MGESGFGFFFSSRRRHTRLRRDWSSDVCSSDLNTLGSEVYFDLSEKEIQIETDFNGKEIIIFGIFEPKEDTIISIKGPNMDTKILKKEKLFGFWFNTKKIIYKELPSIFFLSSSAPIHDILNKEAIIKEKLYFDDLLTSI